MPVVVNGLPMWLCHQCGALWPRRNDDGLLTCCALCVDPQWSLPREDGRSCPLHDVAALVCLSVQFSRRLCTMPMQQPYADAVHCR